MSTTQPESFLPSTEPKASLLLAAVSDMSCRRCQAIVAPMLCMETVEGADAEEAIRTRQHKAPSERKGGRGGHTMASNSVGLVQGTTGTKQGRKYENNTNKLPNPPSWVGVQTQGGGFGSFCIFFSYFRPCLVPCASPTESQAMASKIISGVVPANQTEESSIPSRWGKDGLGGKLVLAPPGDLLKTLEKQTVGTVTAS